MIVAGSSISIDAVRRSDQVVSISATFETNGPRLDRLAPVETTAASGVVVGKTVLRSASKRLEDLGERDLAASAKTGLEPGYQRIPRIGWRQKVEPGALPPVEFIFDRAGRLTADVSLIGCAPGRSGRTSLPTAPPDSDSGRPVWLQID